jgi:His/Glu/Gln/Arg/opine family amino acid ABC transporter permease subunit
MDYAAQTAVLLKGLFPKLLEGFTVTLSVALTSMALALVLGLLLLALRMAKSRLLTVPVKGYIELMRNTPLLLQIYLIYFGLPLLGFFPSEFVCGVVGIALQHAAFLVEILRGGIESISQRQREAARLLACAGSRVPRNTAPDSPEGAGPARYTADRPGQGHVARLGHRRDGAHHGGQGGDRAKRRVDRDIRRHRRVLSGIDLDSGWRLAARRAAHGGEVLTPC